MAAGGDERGREDLTAGLAALGAKMTGLEGSMESGFAGIRELLDAKLDPLIKGAAKQELLVAGLGERVTRLETERETQIRPAVEAVWKQRKTIQGLEEHAKRCDERAKQQGSRSWALIMAWVSPMATGIVVWLLTRLGIGTGR